MATTNTSTVNTSGKIYDSGTNISQNWIEVTPAGANIFAIEDVTLSSAIKVLGTGDTIYIEGNFADYQFKQNGKTVTIDNGLQRSAITMNSMTTKVQVTTTLQFLDGSVTLSNKAGGVKVSINGLDDNNNARSQQLTTKYADVKINTNDSDVAANYFTTNGGSDTTNYALTTSVDTIVGKAGVNIAVTGTGETYTAFDSITATGTASTLTITDTTGASAAGVPDGASVSGIQTATVSSTGTIGSNWDGVYVPGTQETDTFTFQALGAGETVTIAGRTVAAGPNGATAADVAAAYASTDINNTPVGGATPSGSVGNGYYASTAGGTYGNQVVLTSYNIGDQTNLIVTGTALTGIPAVNQDSSVTVTAAGAATDTVSFLYNGVTLTTPAVGGMGSVEDIAAAIVATINGYTTSVIATTAPGGVVNIDAPFVVSLANFTPSAVGATFGAQVVATPYTAAIPAAAPAVVVVDGTDSYFDYTTVGAEYDVSGYVGLTQFNANSIGGDNINAAGTTAVTVKDSALGDGGIQVTGGSNISITAAGVDAGENGGIYAGDDSTTGTVNITATTGKYGGNIGWIEVGGGTVVTVNQQAGNTAGNWEFTNQGPIGVWGSAVTTSVTVNQAAAASDTAASAATSGVATVDAIAKAPGVNGVTAVQGYEATTAKTAAVGASTGYVQIYDNNIYSTKANTISTVSLSNFNGADIASNALRTLSLSGTSGSTNQGSIVTVYNSNGTNATTTTATLALTVNSLGQYANSSSAAQTIFLDNAGAYSTINLVTAGAASSISLAAKNLTALNISGTATVTAPLLDTASTLAIAVTGAAGFNDGNAGVYNGSHTASTLGSGLTLTSTSSGTVSVSLDATTQTFVGSSTGTSVITINADSGQGTFNTISGNGSADKLILGGTTYGLTTAQQAKLTGFEQIQFGVGVNGTVNLATLAPTATFLEVGGSSASTLFTNAAVGATLQIDKTTTAVGLTYADASTTASTVTLGKATNASQIDVGSLTISNSSGASINTLNVVSNKSTYVNMGGTIVAPENTITRLNSLTLGTINVTGNAGLLIDNLGGTNAATTFTLNNNSTGNGTDAELVTLEDNVLTTLNMGGTGNTEIENLITTTRSLTIIDTNSASGTAIVGNVGFVAGSLTSLTLTGNVQIGDNTNPPTASATIGATTGITVSGATDNAHVNISLNAAASGKTNTVTLGNGNDYVMDTTVDGTVKITVGTGSNLIDVSTGTKGTLYLANVTLGADVSGANPDTIVVGQLGTSLLTTNTIITGAGQADQIDFALTPTSSTLKVLTTAFDSAAQGVTATLATLNNIGDIGTFQYAGNTYLVQEGSSAQDNSVIELIGVHTFNTTVTDVVTLLS